jgi:hypothetical protein
MKKFTFLVLTLVLTFSVSFGETIKIKRVSELIKQDVIIARVLVLSVQNTGAKEGYGKIAKVKVTDSIKGLDVDSVIELENDAVNVDCPNVSYDQGEDILLFAIKMPNGHYETLYADAGKFSIKNESVDKQPFVKGESYSSAKTKINREIVKLSNKSK